MKEMMYKDTIYAKMRRALYNAVLVGKETQETQWGENGRCYMAQTFGDRGIIAIMQRKANNKGWVVFFTLCMYRHERNQTPFMRNLNVVLTINETPSGVRLLWFINGKPQWMIDSSQMASSWKFHRTGYIIKEIMNQIKNVYSPEDFIPILKYMQNPASAEYDVYGLNQKWIKKLSGGTNPKQILNTIYGKDGQDGLSKCAFGGINKINSFATFAVVAEIVRYFRPFAPSFFDKIDIGNFGVDDIRYMGLMYADVTHIQYFTKYFNNNKIQQDFINAINDFRMCSHPDDYDEPAERFFKMRIWGEACDAGRMFKQIKNKAVRRNLIAFKGTVRETHDLITIEHAKLSRQNKEIKYTKKQLELVDNQHVTDNIISVLPKSTIDLILWGSQQHNCIGSYGELVNGRCEFPNIIVGFMNTETNDWVGHAQVIKNRFIGMADGQWSIVQLRGKHNSNLDEADNKAIRNFLELQFDLLNQITSVYDDLN